MPTVTLAAAPNQTLLICEKVTIGILPSVLEKMIVPIRACIAAGQSGERYKCKLSYYQVSNTPNPCRVSIVNTLTQQGISLSLRGARQLIAATPRYTKLARALAGEQPIEKGRLN